MQANGSTDSCGNSHPRSYDVGKKPYSNRNDKQKALNEIAESLSTTAFNITKLGRDEFVILVITPHDAIHSTGRD
jgi:hypothetical protein